jgi:hypothetical protein
MTGQELASPLFTKSLNAWAEKSAWNLNQEKEAAFGSNYPAKLNQIAPIQRDCSLAIFILKFSRE